ncbi:hypothetical protein B296_00001948 [Ensete ventricosum]|uniref:Uncharacterized protein n=1 Tax=Ensete ventricosum TaxID=4639 RepID=A0A427AM18_ENSVE|nr:hypothetical protein B296_00001948 [Ensete ventricosum]
MLWELSRSSLAVHRRNQKVRWEHAGRSLEEDRKTHRKNVGGYWIGRRFGLHPKKIGNGHRWTLTKRTRKWP